jgi:hypothetical protein
MQFLITSDGEWLVAGSKEAEARVGYESPDFDLTGFAVRNLGFIEVLWEMPGRVRLRLHPDQLAPGALSSLKARLDTFGDATIVVEWLTRQWQDQEFAGAAGAVARIDDLVACVGRTPYRATRQDIATLEKAGDHPLKLLLQKWRVSFNRFSESVMPFAMQHGIFSRMMIVGVRKSAPDPTFRYIGDGFATMYGESFTVNAIGEKIENQPDKAYGAWVRPFYAEVAQSGAPLFDVVDAILPKLARGPWVRYQRLLLPWQTPSGEVFVTLASSTLALGAPANDSGDQAATVSAEPPSERGRAARSASFAPRYEARSVIRSVEDIRMSATSRSPQSESGKRIL